MNPLRQFSIPFIGLQAGLTVMEFELNDAFFNSFEGNYIAGSAIKVELGFDKRPNLIVLNIAIHGQIKAVCDRCTEQFDLELLDEHKVYVKFHEEADTMDEEEDIIYIEPGSTHLDVSKLLYDFTYLSIPLQKTCDDAINEKKCNPKVLEILNRKADDDKGTEEDDNNTDPRWAALKNLK